MSEKTKLYIDEDWLEPTGKAQNAPGASEGPEVGQAALKTEKGQETLAMGSKEVQEGTSGKKADKQSGLAATPEEKTPKPSLGEKLKKVPTKTWILVGVLLLVLVGAGIMMAVMLGGGSSSQGNKVPETNNSAGKDDNDDQNNGDDAAEEDSGKEIIVLSTGDARVQKLYGYFSRLGFTSELGQLADFYTNRGSFSGEPSDAMMIDLAMANLETETCALPPTDENLMKRYEDWQSEEEGLLPSIELFQGLYNMGCYSGQAVREKVKEIFGKDLKLTMEAMAENPYYGYDATNDEFFNKIGGRGGVFPSFARKLLKAERDGERMYLYETVSVSFPGGPELVSLYDKCLFVQDPETYEKNGCGAEDYQWQTGETKFRLVFKRTDAGNYVFEKLERAERE